MKGNIILAFLLMLSVAYSIYQASAEKIPECSDTIELLIGQSVMESMKFQEEKKILEERIVQVSHQADSLVALAKQENEKVTQLKIKQYERIEAVDHFTQHELVEFFAGLETHGAEVGT